MDYKSDTLGSNPTGMENFQFSTGDFDRSHMDGDELNTGDVKYHWGMSVFDRGGADQTGSNQPHGLLRADASSHSRNWTKVSYIPGDNKITVSGYGHLWGRVDYSGSNTPAWNTSESFDFKVTWTITLVIGALEETGELNFTIEDPPKGSSTTEPERYYNIEKSHGDNLSGTIINPYFGTFVDGMFERLKGACDSKLTYLTAKLKGALSKQHRLFLPGSGELLFSQGTFNNQGDFICNVHFNGAAM
ncbi:hypothetical protein K4K49_012282 [Colletotrichum sp. SAR 10_70]|nr:hypothetical protein K4K50_011728 [Colletotrichum sp. SAR 10_71]KAI8190087.1 hypothetical protein K4K49_012282 [Colletotrichum sp. SAR 10_70]